MRAAKFGLVLALWAPVALGLGGLGWFLSDSSRTATSDAVIGMHFEPYEPQKAIYHVMEGERFFERRFKNLLTVANNHLAAVAFGDLDLRVMLQGGGIDLLIKAKHDAALAASIDQLRRSGVRFIVCRNTLVQRGVDPAVQMHGVKPDDIVASSVAEIVRLSQQGFVTIRF